MVVPAEPAGVGAPAWHVTEVEFDAWVRAEDMTRPG